MRPLVGEFTSNFAERRGYVLMGSGRTEALRRLAVLFSTYQFTYRFLSLCRKIDRTPDFINRLCLRSGRVRIYCRSIILMGLLCAALSAPASSQMSPYIPQGAEEILRKTMAENGYLTEEMHIQFWDLAGSSGNEDDLRVGMEFVRSNLVLTKALQTGSWESMLLSWESREVIKTRALEVMADNLDKFILENNPFPSDTAQHREFAEGFESEYLSAMQSIDAYLLAASKRQRYVNTPSGRFPFSKAMIQRVLRNIEGSFERADRLLDPEWRED